MGLKQDTCTGNNPTFNTVSIAYRITANLFAFASFFGVVALSADRFLATDLSSPQIPGACDSQVCCCFGNFSLGVLCNPFVE